MSKLRYIATGMSCLSPVQFSIKPAVSTPKSLCDDLATLASTQSPIKSSTPKCNVN